MSIDASWIEISRKGLLENINTFRGLLEKPAKLMIVVKANAYGHGLDVVSGAAATAVDWFGVDAVTEALSVHSASPGKPILILGHSDPRQAETIVRKGFRQVVYRWDVAEALAAAAEKHHRKARIHLKIETGTNRQGIPPDELAEFVRALDELSGIEIEGAYTHFANIEDTLDASFAQLQIERFKNALELLGELGVRPKEVHAAATAGILLYPETHFTLVRLGIGAYGVWPSRETQIASRERGRQIQLRPVMTWKTRIAQLKPVQAGEYVGYGLSFQAGRRMTLAVIPVGYSEGYDRKLSHTGRALVGGKPAPVVGRVAMNMTMLDVTDADPVTGDEVVLMGRQGQAEITADELAEKTGTIAYEALSRVNPLLERRLT